MGGHPEASAASGSDQPGAMGGHPGSGGSADKDKAAMPPAKTPVPPAEAQAGGSHSFVMNRSPVHKIYLHVAGAPQPAEAPEVYYIFTARTLERHGGVPLGKTVHKAEVVMDKGVWRADIFNSTFGSAEVFSRFKLGDSTVFSQYNFLHFLTPEDAKGLEPPAEAVMPADWPAFSFPEGSYNGMPFRGLQTGRTTDFKVTNLPEGAQPVQAYLVDPRPQGTGTSAITHNPKNNSFTVEPPEDPTLVVVSSPMGGSSRSKTAVAVVEIPSSKEVLTFSMSITLSRWSYRKLNYGLGLAAITGLGTTVAVRKRRKKFKFNKLGLPEEEPAASQGNPDSPDSPETAAGPENGGPENPKA
jgi:hypothetical protein